MGAHWVIHNGTKINLWCDKWIPHWDPIRSMIQGPFTASQEKLTLAEVWNEGNWNFQNLTIQMPQDLITKIKCSFSTNPGILNDLLIWGLNGNGLFSCQSMYNAIVRSPTNSFYLDLENY